MIHADKIVFLTGGADLACQSGLEIGARDAPLVRKPDFNVAYADYADTDTIRAGLAGTGIDPAGVVDVDIVTNGGRVSDATNRRFDYVVASHVLEHVPDLLGWLADMHRVLRPGGTLGLAVPDRRFTFDRARAESSIAEAVEAWILGYSRPSIRQIFDSAWQAIETSPEQGWAGDVPSAQILAQRHLRLRGMVRWSEDIHASGQYVDAHCWVFTAASFLTLLEQAAIMGLFPFVLERFRPADEGGYEFLVLLRAAEAGMDADIAASIVAAQADLATHAGEAAFAAVHASAISAAAIAEAAAALEALDAMRASRSWRLTAPLRRLNAWIAAKRGA
jgi:SAM-dependent methyltransferase